MEKRMLRCSHLAAGLGLGMVLAACGSDQSPASSQDIAGNEPVQAAKEAASPCVTLGTTFNTEIQESSPNDNFGKLGTMFTGTANTVAQSLVWFDLSSIPSSATIVSSTLTLTEDAYPTAGTVDVYRIANPSTANCLNPANCPASGWDQTKVSWGTFNEAYDASTVWGSFTSTTTTESLNVNLTSLTQDWVSGTYTNNGFLLGEAGVKGQATYMPTSNNSGSTPPMLEVCYNTCAAGLSSCSGTCVNETNDPNNCGACGNVCDTPPPTSCYTTDGSCSSSQCVYNPLPINTPCPGGLCDGVGDCNPCSAGLSLCSGTCVSESNDPNNCGGCGNVCPAGDICTEGACGSAYQVVQVAVGAEFACAVLASGQVECWGGVGTGFGELGNGTTGGSTTPVFVSGLTNVSAVFAAAFNACALLTNGTVQCWGDNSEGQLGNGTTLDQSTPVPVVGLGNVVSASGATTPGGNGSFSCAVLGSGGVECWGSNDLGQLGNGTFTNSPIPVPVVGISTALAVTAGDGFACALLQGGTVSCWGDMYGGTIPYGTTPVPVAGISGAAGISASYDSACAVFPSGSVSCWGANNQGQLGDGSFTTSLTPVAVSGFNTSTALQGSCGSAAATHCAGTFSGGAYCWGNNNYGQLGDGTTTTSDVPVVVTGLTGAVAIASGGGAGTGNGSSCAIVAGGAVVCWGSNVYGQLGNGSQTSSSTFVQVTGL
jgi:alpha-tubulin suppressor-like RCC1 family protein